MKKILALVLLCAFPLISNATAYCVVDSFEVDAYDHSGVYLHGDINGVAFTHMVLCGGGGPNKGGENNCSDEATKNRLSIALAAQLAGKKLQVHFNDLNSCSEFEQYMRPNSIRLKN